MAAAQTTTEQIAARRLDTVDRKVDLSLMVENRRGKTLLEARQRCLGISHLRILFGAPDGRAAPITNHQSPITNHESPIISLCYGRIWSVQRNCQVAIALIATETANSEISGTEIFAGPLPVSKRNIQGSRIMA